MKFWMEDHFSGVSICSFHLILKEFTIPSPNRLPIVLPSSKLLSHYPETLVHLKTMKFKISQIPYSESSLRLSGCSILLYLASFGSMIIFPMSELYILHEDANDFGAIIIFSLLQLRYMVYPQTLLQCDPQCLEDVRIESIKFLDTEKNLNRIFSIEEIQLHFSTK